MGLSLSPAFPRPAAKARLPFFQQASRFLQLGLFLTSKALPAYFRKAAVPSARSFPDKHQGITHPFFEKAKRQVELRRGVQRAHLKAG
jgi:hypothetical protein